LFVASILDGYIAKNDGGVDWLPTNDSSVYGEFYKSVDTVIMGKKTYDQVRYFGYIHTMTRNHMFLREIMM
jgi:dihydrofolate reductase